MLLLLAVAAAAPMHFHFDASEFANAVYHVGCMTDRLPCSKAIYTKFWKETWHATPEDGARFDEYRRICDEIEGASGQVQPAPYLPNHSSAFPTMRARVRIVAAALASKSAGEFRRRAAAEGKAGQIGRLAAILEYFEKRLHPWWVVKGRPIVQPRIKGVEREVTKLGVPEMAGEVASFVDVRQASRDLYIHAIPSPEFEGDAATATPALNHFCVEIMHKFDVDAMAWVALHELTHSLYDLSPVEEKQRLMNEFVESKDPAAQPFYVYLNEAMATAVQLLSLERNGKTDSDPYRERFIPRLGNAALPLVREAFARKMTLFHGFAAQYIAAGRQALGAEADSVRFRFASADVLGPSEMMQIFFENVHLPGYMAGENPKKFPRLNVIQVGRYSDLKLSGADAEQRHRGFILIHQLNPQQQEMIIAGRDEAAVAELTKWLADSKEPDREGVIFAID